jgi:hypothetical protein
VPNPPGARENSIRGYTRFFPGYQMVDTTEGIYHSFKCGNIEVFMCDDRSARSPELECLIPASFNTVSFQPPAGHSVLGKKQMDWLVNGLKTSTAKWKFIMSGVAFNKGYARVLKFALNPIIQNVSIPFTGYTGKGLVVTLVDTWNGYPDDQNRLMNECHDNGITNVIFLSSDSHTSAIDDGSNAGFPEIMAGNLEHSNSHIAQIMHSLGFDVWSAGGQGIGNSNTREAYGSVEIFGDDSVQLCIRDLYGIKVTSLTIHDGNLVTGAEENNSVIAGEEIKEFFLYPSPVADELYFHPGSIISSRAAASLSILNAEGQLMIREDIEVQPGTGHKINLGHLKPGIYLFQIELEGKKYVRKFVKE